MQLRGGSVNYSNGASSHRSLGRKNNQKKTVIDIGENAGDGEDPISPMNLKVSLREKNSSSNS
tara:strand:- start:300 stop:488 length:189 start_codon:yes stop_codon:yes gene_type:complete